MFFKPRLPGGGGGATPTTHGNQHQHGGDAEGSAKGLLARKLSVDSISTDKGPGGVANGAKYKTLPRLQSLYNRDNSFKSHDLLDGNTHCTASGELLGLELNINIPYTQVGAASKSTKIYTEYVVCLSLPPPPTSAPNTPAKEWKVKKRYSQFIELDKQLKQILATIKTSAAKLAPLPPKRFLNSFDDHVILERKKGLADYLQSALNVSSAARSAEFTQLLAVFLELPGTKSMSSATTTHSSVQSSTLSRTHEGGNGHVKESSAQLVHTAEGGEAHHGFLYKRGGLYQNKPFKMAFCVLSFNDAVFRFYRTSRPQLLGAIELMNQPEARIELLSQGDMGIPEDGFGFRLFTPERELIMYADTIEDRISWVSALETVIKKNQGAMQTGTASSPPAAEPLNDVERPKTPPKPSLTAAATVVATTRKPANKFIATPVQLAERELAYITSIREDWAIDWNDIVIEEKIGGGAFGTVYKGKCWGSIVAVKQLNTSGTVSEELKLALEKEVGVLSKLRHPNVVLYIGASFTEVNAAMLTEWCSRKSLFDLLKAERDDFPLDSSLMLNLALQISRGMCYLHSRRERIIHRDLKSLNVLITEGYEAKVADFGLTVMREATMNKNAGAAAAAAHVSSTPGVISSPPPLNTRESTSVSVFSNSGADFFGTEGTAQWMAPEVMEGGRYNHKVDVYSFGILLTELLTRKMPFKDVYPGFDFVDAVLDRAERPTIPYWAQIPPTTTSSSTNSSSGGPADASGIDVEDGITQTTTSSHSTTSTTTGPNALGEMVMRCTNRDPSSRPDFTQIIKDLEAIIEANNALERFQYFDLPRLREMMDAGDIEDVIHASGELYVLSRELLFFGASLSELAQRKRQILQKFLSSSNLVASMLGRLAYGKASRVVEKGGEYESEALPMETMVDLVCSIRQLMNLSSDPLGMIQMLYTPKKDPLEAVLELFLRVELPGRGVDACGSLMSEFKMISTKLKGVFDELMESKLEEALDDRRNPVLGTSHASINRRRTVVATDKEHLLWRCRTFDLLPNKFVKRGVVGSSREDTRQLEAEIRAMEAVLMAKRRLLLDNSRKDVHKDFGKV